MLQKRVKNKLDRTSTVSTKSSKSFLSSTPVSLKGSFLRNKLENPLFSPFFGKRNISSSSLSKVFNANASDSEEEEIDEETVYSDSEEEGEITETEPDSRWSLLRLRKKRRNSLPVTTSTQKARFGSSFFSRRNKQAPKPSKLRLELRLSSDSNTSNSSNISSSEESEDVEILTKFEEENNSINTKGYLLYTHKGQAVRVQFKFDYLLISPVFFKLSLSRQRSRIKPRIIYYEDLALWTNNAECLRLVHIRNKHTALQERSEIKLFVNKKKLVVTTLELNEELKDRVSLLMASKMNLPPEEAKKLLRQTNSEADVDRMVQKIDRDCEKHLVQSYTKNLISEEPCYDLMNV